ncbi:hypothetical protein F5Y19DRAFT_421022 [Xylariaceae sp. FL1651]|nr:hypothetical protein F5Y19DRAFT_421022 [Xylariaceae sp. FL1651]
MANGFLSPTFTATGGYGNYGHAEVFVLGASQLIAYETIWTEYRIELWQQALAGGSVTLAKSLVRNQTAGKHLAQSFIWTVQTYDLVLETSPVFCSGCEITAEKEAKPLHTSTSPSPVQFQPALRLTRPQAA